MQKMINVLYDNIDENDIVYATKNKEKDKTDIIITINNIEKNLSLKIGDKNSFHLEPISKFIQPFYFYLLIKGIERFIFTSKCWIYARNVEWILDILS